MTTHQVAELLKSLHQGFGSALKSDAAHGLEELSQFFQSANDIPLKSFLAEVRKWSSSDTASPTNSRTKKKVNLEEIIRSIEAWRNQSPPPVSPIELPLEMLTEPQLKSILAHFGRKATRGKSANLEMVRALTQSIDGTPINGSATYEAEIDKGVQLFVRLRSNENLMIPEIRAQFEELKQLPKLVFEQIAIRLGYSPAESKEKTFQMLLTNLEELKLAQLRSRNILSGTPGSTATHHSTIDMPVIPPTH